MLERKAFLLPLGLLLTLTGGRAIAQEMAPAPLPPDGASAPGTPGAEATRAPAEARPPSEVTGEARVREHFAPVIARPGGLTADEAARRAAEVSPTARAARARVASAEASVSEVKWQYVPRLTLSASYTRLSPQPTTDVGLGGGLVVTDTPAGERIDPATDNLFAADATQAFQQVVDQWSLNAGLVVPVSDYLLNLSKAMSGAKTARESAELNERAERLLSAADARIAYYEWARAKLVAREATKSVERAQKQLEVLTAQREAGQAARADVLRADAFLATTELDLRRANTAEAIARERLHVLMTGGEAQVPSAEIGEDILLDSDPAEFDSASIEDLQREAIAQRLEVRALGLKASAQRDKASVERSSAYPRLEAFGNLTYANPNQRIVPQVPEWAGSWDLGARLSWTLNDLGKSGARAKIAEADAAVSEADQENVEFALRQEVVSEHRRFQESALATSSARRGLLAAEAAYADRVILFENGRATSLDLLEAETSLVEARNNLVAAYIAQRIARVRLEHALGRDIASVPASGSATAAKK